MLTMKRYVSSPPHTCSCPLCGPTRSAICITDTKPRRFDAGDCRLMNNCAELAIRALEVRGNKVLVLRLG